MALEFRHVEEILNQQADGNILVLPGRWIVTRHGDELRFRKSSEAASDYQYVLFQSQERSPSPKVNGIEVETFVVNGAKRNSEV